MRRRYHDRRARAIAAPGGRCVRCNAEHDLELDHIDPSTKLFTISQAWSVSAQRFEAEVAKCQLLCSTCHIEKTRTDRAGLITPLTAPTLTPGSLTLPSRAGSSTGRASGFYPDNARSTRVRLTIAERFWRKVDQSGGPDACWPWLGKPEKNGYGRFKAAGRKHGAHRMSPELTLGRPLGPKMLACHACNTPLCCNPRHLYEGTSAQNVRDSINAGTFQSARPGIHGRRGEVNGHARLTETQVLEIYARAHTGERYLVIAADYGATKTMARNIKLGRTWAWLTGA